MDIKNFNLETILQDDRLSLSKWYSLAQSKKPEDAFMACLAPAIEYIDKNFQQKIQELKLHTYFTEKFLSRWIEKSIIQQLKPMISKVCVLEMHAARQNKLLKGDTPEARYQNFIQSLQKKKNSMGLFKKYPALKEIIETSITHYLNAQIEFLIRFSNDNKLINFNFFNSDLDHYQINEILQNGDTHNNGRRVMTITMVNAQKEIKKFVYKPRSVKIDTAFQHLITWVNSHFESIPLMRHNILDQEDYGWSEFITQQDCNNKEEINDFYYRSGILLALLYALQGNDIHYENLIAHGSHPIIVDLECLLKPFFPRKDLDYQMSYRTFVLDSLILPYRHMIREDYSGFDISAVMGSGGEISPYKVMQWENIGTDEMKIVRAEIEITKSNNLPHLKNFNINPLHYEDILIRGFEDCYRLFLQHRDFLLSENSPLQKFKSCQTRILFRNTSDYGKLLYESYHPELLYYPQKRTEYFNWLKRILEHYPLYESVVDAELFSIKQGDIPVFNCTTDAKEIFSNGHALAIPAMQSGWEILQENLASTFSETDLRIQKRIITNSFQSTILNIELANIIKNPAAILQLEPPNLMLNAKNNYKKIALHIANKILEQINAIKIISSKAIGWPTLQMVHQNICNPQLTDMDLYHGLAGIALAFGQAAYSLNSGSYLETTHQCLQHLHRYLRKNNTITYSTKIASQNVGGFTGLGGMLYSISYLYTLHPELIDSDCLLLLLDRMDQLIEYDETLDIIQGSAGCLSALLGAKHLLPNSRFKKTATMCVNRILKLYPSPNQYTESYQGIIKTNQPLLSFSHGCMGIAWALSQYQNIFPTLEVEEWVINALNYQASCFANCKNHWPDFQKSISTNINTSWCYGAAGIGLALLEIQRYYPEKVHTEEIANALQLVLNEYNTMKSDDYTLCHGLIGNLDFLIHVRQNHPHLLSEQEYLTYVSAMVSHVAKYGVDYALPGKNANVGLMMGLSGLAYQMLRIADPKNVPSILLLKSPLSQNFK